MGHQLLSLDRYLGSGRCPRQHPATGGPLSGGVMCDLLNGAMLRVEDSGTTLGRSRMTLNLALAPARPVDPT